MQDYIITLPLKLLHDLISGVIYSKFWKFKFSDRSYFPLSKSPHVLLMYLGLYEYPLIHLLKKYLKNGDTFVDVGANIGYFSAAALKIVGKSGKVIAFEPDPRCHQSLFKLKNSGYQDNFIIEKCLVSNRESRTSLFQTKDWGTTTAIKGLRPQKNIANKLSVQSVMLGGYLITSKVSRIKLVKIDVEGFEMQVLMGLERLLKHQTIRPIIMVEVYPFAMLKSGFTLKTLRKWIKKYSYTVMGDIQIENLQDYENQLYNLVLLPKWMTGNNNISSQKGWPYTS